MLVGAVVAVTSRARAAPPPSSVLVPVLVRRRRADPDQGQAYSQRLLTLAVLALGVATLLAVAAAKLLTMIYAGGEEPAFRELVENLSYLILPMIFFTVWRRIASER